MSATFVITTLIELAVSCLLIYGFMHEDKVIAFEQAVKRIVVGNIRRTIRMRRYSRLNSRYNKVIRKRNNNSKQETKDFIRAKF